MPHRDEAIFDVPPDLPAPVDDGAADHLRDRQLPHIALPSTHGGSVLVSAVRRAVVFTYPRTGLPDHPAGPMWDRIPGARGCTPQSCAFRDLQAEFRGHGVDIYGLSTQTTAYQRAFAERMHVPYAILSDASLELTRTLHLPTFEYDIQPLGGGGPDTLLKRMVWYVEDGVIRKVWYPVFPSDAGSAWALEWLRSRHVQNGA